jgi:hypothetical protein
MFLLWLLFADVSVSSSSSWSAPCRAALKQAIDQIREEHDRVHWRVSPRRIELRYDAMHRTECENGPEGRCWEPVDIRRVIAQRGRPLVFEAEDGDPPRWLSIGELDEWHRLFSEADRVCSRP